MMAEQWSAILGYEGFYEASSFGRIRSVDRVVSTYSARAGKVVPLVRASVILSQSVTPAGYCSVTLSKDGKAKTHRVNVLVCKAFHGESPTGNICRHLNGMRTDNKSLNLAWGTAKENQWDRRNHGTHLCGESVSTAKFSKDQVQQMRAMKFRNAKKIFGISKTHHHRIKRGESWAHVA